MKALLRVVAILGAAAFVAACTSDSSSTASTTAVPIATVIETIDGDTVEVTIDGRRETVRLIGVDTPETVHPTKPVECFGPEASAHLAGLLPRGTRVTLARDAEARDRYGRLLAYMVRTDDGLFVNLDLVAGGWATTLVIEPNTAHSATFAAAAEDARRRSLGLWGACER